MLIVISLLGIVAGFMLTRFEPTIHDQLHGAAQVITSDLAYARSLAVSNGSTYRIQFSPENDRYVLSHSGDNPVFDTLPPSAYRQPDDPPHEQSTEMNRLPLVSGNVELVAVTTAEDPPQGISQLEFGPLGETTQAAGCIIWIASGQGDVRRYISVRVNPITGLAWIGDFRVDPPPILQSSGDDAPIRGGVDPVPRIGDSTGSGTGHSVPTMAPQAP